MTNLTKKQAVEACAASVTAATALVADYSLALLDLKEAEAKLAKERSNWDESDAATGAGAAGIVLALLSCFAPDPTFVTKALCAGGIFGGGLTISASEQDREEEIRAAKLAVLAAQRNVEKLRQLLLQADKAVTACILHHQVKVKPL